MRATDCEPWLRGQKFSLSVTYIHFNSGPRGSTVGQPGFQFRIYISGVKFLPDAIYQKSFRSADL